MLPDNTFWFQISINIHVWVVVIHIFCSSQSLSLVFQERNNETKMMSLCDTVQCDTLEAASLQELKWHFNPLLQGFSNSYEHPWTERVILTETQSSVLCHSQLIYLGTILICVLDLQQPCSHPSQWHAISCTIPWET